MGLSREDERERAVGREDGLLGEVARVVRRRFGCVFVGVQSDASSMAMTSSPSSRAVVSSSSEVGMAGRGSLPLLAMRR
jgi:hypothetical protein